MSAPSHSDWSPPSTPRREYSIQCDAPRRNPLRRRHLPARYREQLKHCHFKVQDGLSASTDPFKDVSITSAMETMTLEESGTAIDRAASELTNL